MTVEDLHPRKTAIEAGFCIMDDNADDIASYIIERLAERWIDDESQVNRLYRGREVYNLSEGAKCDLTKLIEQWEYAAKTAREVMAAQSAPTLIAAE